jgi:ABC-type multidrug transport system ATPase subunit
MHLEIRGISTIYPNGVQALKNVTLTIPPGMYGLLGRNGAGKSTLMRILATLQEPDVGSIRLGDIDVVRQKDRVRETLGYLPQSFGFHPRVSAERLLDHFAVLKGVVERGARRDLVESLLRRTNLWEVRRQRVGTFSGGMRQRLGVAIALVGNPKLIVVDEPTAGLDPEERVRFLNLLSEIGEDSVVIGVFAPGMDERVGVPLHLQRYRIRSGRQTIRITVPSLDLREGGEPARAGIDPRRKLIDRERGDNVKELKVAGADSAGDGS